MTILSSIQGCASDQWRLTGDHLHACDQQDQRSPGFQFTICCKIHAANPFGLCFHQIHLLTHKFKLNSKPFTCIPVNICSKMYLELKLFSSLFKTVFKTRGNGFICTNSNCTVSSTKSSLLLNSERCSVGNHLTNSCNLPGVPK